MTLLPSVLAWEMEKPSTPYCYVERQESNESNGNASVGLGVEIGTYHIGDPKYAPYDYLNLRIVATANTREILSYPLYNSTYNWHELSDEFLITGPYPDDGLIELRLDGTSQLPIQFQSIRFYGGPGSGEYNYIYVSTNGFVTFYTQTWEGDPVEYWYGYPYSIPTREGPNAFIAPLWTDLKPNSGGQIKAGVIYEGAHSALCISWINVPDANGQPQTFQLLIYEHQYFWQNPIRFQYKNVTTSGNVKVGMEDQSGAKGVSVSPLAVGNGKAFLMAEPTYYAYIGFLTIKIIKIGGACDIIIPTGTDQMRGYNVKLQSPEPDPTAQFAFALSGEVVLLLMGLLGPEVALAGTLLGGALIVYEIVAFLATNMSPAKEVVIQDKTAVNYAKAPSYLSYEDDPSLFPATVVDADFGINVDWVLKDIGPQEIQIIAELEYLECDLYGGSCVEKTISTISDPITLKMVPDAGNSIDDPNVRQIAEGTYRAFVGIGIPSPGTDDVEDFYKIWVEKYQWIDIIMQPPESPNINFDVHLYNTSKQRVASQTNIIPGIGKRILWQGANSAGYWYIEVNATQGLGIYNLTVTLGWGSCPFVYTWNGNEYVIDNNILPTSEINNCSDVEDYYRLEQPLISRDGKYCLLLSEFEREHSYFDTVKLIAIDHATDANIALDPNGAIFTYKNPYAPISAIDEYGNSRLTTLTTIDNDYYEGRQGSYLLIDFGNLDISKGAKLIIRANLEIVKSPCIHVQILNSEGNWISVATVQTRTRWSIQIVDLSNYLPDAEGQLKVRLYFTFQHKIDYVGLDTTSQERITMHYAYLVYAFHSSLGNVKKLLMKIDGKYTELLPNQQIELAFILLRNTKQTRTFVLYTKGRYHTITDQNP